MNEPASLLVGIDAPFTAVQPDETPSAPIHKRHLLAKVTALHYIYSTADRDPYGSTFEFPGITTAGRVPKELLADLESKVDLDRYLGAEQALSRVCSAGSSSFDDLFPGLERRTIGLWQRNLWLPSTPHSRLSGAGGSTARARLQMMFESQVSKRIPIPLARYACQSATHGPLMTARCDVPHGDDARPAAKVEINSTHNVEFGSSIYGQIYPGIVNYLYVPACELVGQSAKDRVIDWMMEIVSGIQLTGMTWRGKLNDADRHNTVITFLLPRPDHLTEKSEADRESLILNLTLKHFLGSDHQAEPTKWTDKVSFAWADSMPECKACGRSCIRDVTAKK